MKKPIRFNSPDDLKTYCSTAHGLQWLITLNVDGYQRMCLMDCDGANDPKYIYLVAGKHRAVRNEETNGPMAMTKEQLFDFLKENYPEQIDWLLWNPEYL